MWRRHRVDWDSQGADDPVRSDLLRLANALDTLPARDIHRTFRIELATRPPAHASIASIETQPIPRIALRRANAR